MMDVMRKAIYMLSVLCVAALWGGCQRGGGEEGTAEVTLRFATRADGTDGTDPNALPNEDIKTLRVILYKAGEDGVYSFYDSFYRTVDASENGIVLETSMRIYDVPLGNYRFYVIGNEESVGKKYDTETAVEANLVQSSGGGMKLQVLDESRTYFPKTEAGIADKGLPMAGAVQVTVEKGMDDVEVELQRAVAKVKLTVSNATDVPMTVEQIRFGSFAADRCYLFGETDLDVSEETNYVGMLFGDPDKGGLLNITVGAFSDADFVCYVYPSAAGGTETSTAYTLGLKLAGEDWKGNQPFVTTGGNVLRQLERNKQLNINARVSANASITINWSVTTWVNAPVAVPPFE